MTQQGDTTERFTSLGKQVLLDGEHYADARDDAAAAEIAFARNRVKVRGRSLSQSTGRAE